MKNEIKIPIKPVIRNFTVTVKIGGLAVARIRLWIASLIVRLGCMVGGLGFKIDEEK